MESEKIIQCLQKSYSWKFANVKYLIRMELLKKFSTVFEKDFKGAEYFKCIVNAITAAVYETDVAGHWDEHKEVLEADIETILASKQESAKVTAV